MQNYFFLLDFSMRKFIKIQFDLGVPAIAVGLSAISLLAKLGTESGIWNGNGIKSHPQNSFPISARKGCRSNP